MSKFFTDSVGNALKPGDIIRMYHFTGARNRKYYMYKRFLGYKEKNGTTFAIYQSLTDEGHGFTDARNKLKNSLLVVERAAPNHLEDLKKNPKMRD